MHAHGVAIWHEARNRPALSPVSSTTSDGAGAIRACNLKFRIPPRKVHTKQHSYLGIIDQYSNNCNDSHTKEESLGIPVHRELLNVRIIFWLVVKNKFQVQVRMWRIPDSTPK